MIRFIFAILLLTSYVTGSQAIADESHPGLGIESLYAEAVVDYKQGQTKEALAVLDKVLAQDPNHIHALELKALLLKGTDDRAAVKIYFQLAKIVPAKDRGPYFFEGGILLKRLNQINDAIAYFEAAIKLRFNVPESNLFLGIMYFESGSPKKAEAYFAMAERDGLSEMKVVARYYLGLIDFKEGYPAQGAQYLLQSQELAKTIPENKMASDTAANADLILRPFREGTWFANLSAVVQYDTNISEVPGSIGVQAQASNNATAQTVFSAGVGFMSPALETIQWVPSYQLNWNDNFNSNTKAFDFFTNVASLYVNYKALAETSGGFKLQGNFTFNNAPNDVSNPSGPSAYSKYLLAGSIGPYFRTQLGDKLQLLGEFDLQPQDFFTEPLSGTDYLIKLTFRSETQKSWLAPGATLWYEINSTSNSQYDFHSVGFEFFDVIRPTIRDSITLALDYINYNYGDSSPSRSDVTWNPKLTYLHTLSDKWSLVGDLGYTTNSSTLATAYSYNRWVFGAGANYTF